MPVPFLTRFFPCLRASVVILISALLLTGCGEKKRARVPVPPPPTIPSTTSGEPTESARLPGISPKAKPIYVQTGKASWYGAPYHNRRGANGETYDMNALTAAHRTLPLNSVVRVTNVQTGSVALVRITDRGPFVEDRIIDLSLAAAKAVDVWRRGTAVVKLEVMEAPSAIEKGGRWAVQMGGFPEDDARKIQNKLSRRYHSAKVLAFNSPTGDWWVRVRVLDDDKHRAEEVAKNSPAAKEHTFLVRLD
jgi:rare lipoprotein A